MVDLSFDEFASDWKIYRAAERAIEIIAQTIVDVASHIIAQKKLGVVPSYRDTVKVLSKHGMINKELAERLSDLIGMRNIILHEYLETNMRIIFDSIRLVIEDGAEFVDAIKSLLK